MALPIVRQAQPLDQHKHVLLRQLYARSAQHDGLEQRPPVQDRHGSQLQRVPRVGHAVERASGERLWSGVPPQGDHGSRLWRRRARGAQRGGHELADDAQGAELALHCAQRAERRHDGADGDWWAAERLLHRVRFVGDNIYVFNHDSFAIQHYTLDAHARKISAQSIIMDDYFREAMIDFVATPSLIISSSTAGCVRVLCLTHCSLHVYVLRLECTRCRSLRSAARRAWSGTT